MQNDCILKKEYDQCRMQKLALVSVSSTTLTPKKGSSAVGANPKASLVTDLRMLMILSSLGTISFIPGTSTTSVCAMSSRVLYFLSIFWWWALIWESVLVVMCQTNLLCNSLLGKLSLMTWTYFLCSSGVHLPVCPSLAFLSLSALSKLNRNSSTLPRCVLWMPPVPDPTTMCSLLSSTEPIQILY